MNFYFDSLEEFILMSGHGPYVWVCYFVTFVVLSSVLLFPVLKSRKFKRTQRGILKREAASAAANSGTQAGE